MSKLGAENVDSLLCLLASYGDSMHQTDQMEKDKLNKDLGAGTKERKRK